jgi:CDP-diacylglycerol---glycerol-3-phosphate 3-phosphatidyltransferase
MDGTNLANKITIARLLILPFIILLLYTGNSLSKLFSIILFIFIMVGDKIDGMVARKMGKATKFGSFLDSITDKLITSLMFLVLYDFGLVPLWAVFLIIIRDVATESVRVIKFKSEVMPKRSKFSIFKTGLQYVTILFGLIVVYMSNSNTNLIFFDQTYRLIMMALIYLTIFLAYYSFIEMLLRKKFILKIS